MAYVWQPAIWHSDFGAGNIYPLPQPILQCDILQNWKRNEHEVPRKDGGKAYGLARKPLTILISGQYAKNDSGATLDEATMWTTYATLKSKLAAADDEELFEFFLYYDAGSGTYAKFKEVCPDSEGLSLGDANRAPFGYQLQLVAYDVNIYNTAPGS